MKIWLLPIEPFEERYTEQWYRWWPQDLREAGFEVALVGGISAGERRGGEFLDPVDTWKWKGEQVAALARVWHEIDDGDWVLTLDGWGPATTAAAYMRATTANKPMLAAFFHAGSYDPNDFLARCGCRPWALHIENGWMRAVDLVLVGSEYHRQLLMATFGDFSAHVAVVGLPIKRDDIAQGVQVIPWREREKLVVFPHRLAPEKQPEQFAELQQIFERKHGAVATWIRARDVCKTKREYYQLLARARVVVSTALQETFGIAMQEGIALGAWAVAPNRLCYAETLRGNGLLFDTLDEAAEQVVSLLERECGPSWDGYHENAIFRAARAMMGGTSCE